MLGVGEPVTYPNDDHAEVIETAQIIAEDPTGDRAFASDGPDFTVVPASEGE